MCHHRVMLDPDRRNIGAVRLVSWNVRGMNTPVKRGKVFAHLKSLKADICFLQETHIKKSAAKVLRLRWASQIFQSNLLVKAKGVAILIHKKLHFNMSKQLPTRTVDISLLEVY